MPKVVRFLVGKLIHDRTFYRNEEVEYIESFELYNQETGEWHWNYRLDIDSNNVYIVDDTIVMETNTFSNTGTQGEAYKKKYEEWTQEDAAIKEIGKNDYAEAAERYLNVDIKPYDTSDKADYADQHLLPKEYRRR